MTKLTRVQKLLAVIATPFHMVTKLLPEVGGCNNVIGTAWDGILDHYIGLNGTIEDRYVPLKTHSS